MTAAKFATFFAIPIQKFDSRQNVCMGIGNNLANQIVL